MQVWETLWAGKISKKFKALWVKAGTGILVAIVPQQWMYISQVTPMVEFIQDPPILSLILYLLTIQNKNTQMK